MVKTICTIEGMMYSMCESHINDTIRKRFDVKKIKSSYKKNQVIILSNEPFGLEKLKKVINENGYTITEIQYTF